MSASERALEVRNKTHNKTYIYTCLPSLQCICAFETPSEGSSPQSKQEVELISPVKGKQMEDGTGRPTTSTKSLLGESSTGSAGKSASPSTSSLSSPSSASGRAKMSVCGPSSKTTPSSSSSSSLSSSSSSSAMPSAGPPAKVHRARKTMNRPPFPQMKSVESIAAATPEKPVSSVKTDADAVMKKRKVGLDSDAAVSPAGTPEKVPKPQTEPTLNMSPAAGKVEAVATATKEHHSGWLEDLDEEADEEDFHLLYNSYSGDDMIYSDSKSDDGMVETLEAEHLSDNSSGSDRPLTSYKKTSAERDEPQWKLQGKGKGRDRPPVGGQEADKGVDSRAAVTVGSTDYTEVPLDSLDISAADSLSLSPHADGSDAETERLEELPLCSCRMEAPRVDGFSARSSRTCMAIESINGELVGCTNVIVKGETMRPSSRVSLMVLCETHRSHMVKHHCCPGCGYFCLSGTFLECCPDVHIAHRFHRGCVSVLGGGRSRGGVGVGLLFCPHCGEDASEAREVTIPPAGPSSGSNVVTASASSTTTTPSLLPSALAATSRALNHEKKMGEPINARMRCRGDVRKGAELQTQPANATPGEDVVALGDGGVDSVGPSLVLPNGKPVCPSAIPPGDRRAALQRAILTQDTERRKKLRFHPRQLYPAAKQGEAQRVLLMLMEGIDPSYQSDSQNRRCALHAAAQRGLLEVCYLLIQAGAKVDAQDKTLRTPLLEAIVNNHVEVVKYLIQSGACVYHAEEDGSTGLHHAAKLGNLEVLMLLLSTGQVDLNAQDSGGWTPIIWAAEHRHIDVIRALLNRGADVTLRDKEMNVCLHWASFAGSAEIAELVLNAGCPLSSVNLHGDTPLHIAAREGFIDCVTLFLSRGADIDIMNKEGDTPLSLARCDTPVWVALQINRKLRRGISNRVVRTERIICSDVAQGYENVPIPCVNGVDDEGCPSDYKYIAENCETSTMNIDRNITHLQHCSCTDDCSSSNCLCGQLSIRCWYDKDHRLLQEFNKIEPPLIFECNMACSCHKTCKNRVVQAGIKVRLQLYRTEKMGWGVRALQDIPQGSFICEYVGELISDAEADVREDDSYLFDLDNKDGEVYCIDARYYGNISRFINHLCDPNIIPVRVFMLHQDLRFPRIAFFSSRDIFTGQELGFDYGDRFWDIKSKYFTCQCGSEKCKHSAEAIALEQSRLARLDVCPEAAGDAGLTVMGHS
ncbi:histone-lysine N-methyltransferase EHMT2 isoform X3 [Carassius gibelio]|uniref:histone-lysine N-methyltransferase EHMT2 isoform X3 n=1 Tax=Carassius gibelio TaxID=101364 RepID=UPI0022777C70|nr:histone-lysine N-methyltransferase EHMT2 isoform X3 [Carassius gibelio]